MYIWIGCKLPAEFETEIRDCCLSLNRSIGLDTVAFSLPQHISLKISFPTADPDAVLDAVTAFLEKQQAFTVRIQNPEYSRNIIWMSVEDLPQLQGLHDRLDTLLNDRFGVPQHEFDRCFLFHSTLFMDTDLRKLVQMQASLSTYSFARELRIDTFLLGVSETGKAGTYHVVREISAKHA